MKTNSLLAAVALLALSATRVLALTVPVAEDASSTTTGTITAASGAAKGLAVNTQQTAFVRFDLSSPVVPSAITPTDIVSATLRLYVDSANRSDDLTVHAVRGAWTEDPAAPSPEPAVDEATLATIPGADVVKKHFVVVDVTSAVKSALGVDGTKFGFAIQTASATTKVVLGSKEGPSSGYAAELDIEASLGSDSDNGTGAESVTNLILPTTTASTGVIFSGTTPLLHAYGTNNFFGGLGAGNFTMTGGGNTASGYLALASNATGLFNTASGYQALNMNTSGFSNTATGAAALDMNTTGYQNTAGSDDALYQNRTGNNNTASGYAALYLNDAGSNNTATGVGALYSNGADDNTAMGYGALYSNQSGTANVGIGYQSLYADVSGSDNIAVGNQALYSSTGNRNIAIGSDALYLATTGDRNIAIGYKAGASLFGDPSLGSDNIYIGANMYARPNESGAIRIGSDFATTTSVYLGGDFNDEGLVGSPVYRDSLGLLFEIPSSRRFKTDIEDMGKASDIVLSLRPVTFRYKTQKADDAGHYVAQFGLIAEEVAAVDPDLVVRDRDGQIKSVRYEQVNAMLLNEFLKEHKRVVEQGESIAAQKQMIAEQQQQIRTLTSQLTAVTQRVESILQRVEVENSREAVVNDR